MSAGLPARPLDPISSIKVKLGLLVGLSIVGAALVLRFGQEAGVPTWLTMPVTIVAALGITYWLSRGMVAPLREMTEAAARMAGGDYTTTVTATSTDEVGQLARSFTSMAGDLAAVDKHRRQLVATVSHELRTPLAAQQALLENLVDGVVQPDDVVLRGALAQSERLSALVNDLLDLSRIDGGQTRLRTSTFAVCDLLEAGVAEARVQSREVHFDVRAPADLRVTADRARLAQVVANLLDNAIRHSPVGGIITLVAAGDGSGQQWTLEVRDQGPGIAVQDAARLFSRFGAGADSSGGSGLGLAISGWVVELHGGTIAALPGTPESPGAVIRATLPRTPPERRVNPSPDRRSAMNAPSLTSSDVQTPGGAEGPTGDPSSNPSSAVGLSRGAAPAGPGSPTGGVLANLWPERDSGPQPVLLWGSVAVGLLAALILPFRNIGVGVLVVLLAAGGLMFRASGRRDLITVAAAALAVALGLLVILRANEGVQFLAVASAGALAAVTATRARTVTAMVASGAAWVLSGLRGLPLLGKTLTSASKHGLLWPVVRTIAISVVALVVFGGLFASADAVLGSWAGALIPDLAWDSLTFRTFVFVMIGGITLAGSYLALNPPAVDNIALPTSDKPTRAWEWAVPLALVLLTFGAFLVAQGVALFGGHDYVQRTTGLTYAENVHRGFGQLTVITVLTLIVTALVRRRSARGSERDQRLQRIMVAILAVVALLVVASALNKMALYQDAYGWTTLRLFVSGFELWLGVLLAAVLATCLGLNASWLGRIALVSGVVFTLGYGAMNPDAWVASHNISRYADSGRLDITYLRSLGPDATPTISNSALPADLKACALTPTSPQGERDDVLGWNLGRARAYDIDAAHPADRVSNCPLTVGYGAAN